MKQENNLNIPDNIFQKIQKLYAKAMSSKNIGSLKEAEAFMLKVQEYLAEYNLEMSLLNETPGEKTNITEIQIDFKGLVSYGNWETLLMSSICRYNWCTYFYNSATKKITIIGRGDNIGVCRYLYNFITINLIALSKTSYYGKVDEWDKKLSGRFTVEELAAQGYTSFEEVLHKNKLLPYRRYYIRDYLAGAVQGIEAKFAEQQRRQREATNMNGLVLFNKEKLDQYMMEFHPYISVNKSKTIKRGQGYLEGYEGGYNMKIGEALDSNKEKSMLHG